MPALVATTNLMLNGV